MLKAGFTIALVLALLPIYAQVIYVKKDAPGLNNGTSWADAFTDLKQALQHAGYGAEIWVAEGSYAPESPNAFNVPSGFHLPSGVKLLGGFAGNETNVGQRDRINHETILTAIGNTTLSTNVLYVEGTDTTTVLDGFTIKDGVAYALNPWLYPCDTFVNQYACVGGGIYLYSGDSITVTFLSIKNCIFTKNQAMSGGAICANYGAGSGGLQVANCEFNENATSSEGGAISILTGQHPQLSIHIDSCKFMNGYSYHSSSGLSMVNYCPNLDFRLSNSLFYKNKSVFNSGAIYITSGGKRPVIENCVFQENQTELDITSPGIGGAILGSGYRLVNCSFIGNKARIGAVAVVGNVEFVGCLFANNSAVLEAGVLRNSSSCKLINCTFLNNYAGEKGGVIRSFLTSLSDTIVNCIFINNKSGQSGDNIYPNALTKIYMSHCMVDVSDCSTLEMATNPPVDFLTCGPGMLFNVYPRFRDTASGDYRLDACSPLIDQGDGAWALRFGLSADLEGSSRLQNTNIDIGAYETPKLLAEATTQDTRCYGDSDGIANLSISGGFAPYGITWEDGSQASIKTGLPAGIYWATVNDADWCMDTISVMIDQPDSIFLSVVSLDNTNMANPNGMAAVDSIAGGVTPYQYSWSTGASTDSIFNLPAGVYFVTVTDAQGCTKVAQTSVKFMVGAGQAPENKQLLLIYPNPAVDYIKIDLPPPPFVELPFQIELYNAYGERIKIFRVSDSSMIIPLSGYAAGTYLIRFSDIRGAEFGRRMIIKQQ